VIEIPQIKQVVTEHRVYRCTCSCGKIVESDFPAGVDWPVSYGRNMESLVGYLSVRQHLPFKRLQEMIRQFAIKSSVFGTDETGMKVNGKAHWFWTWQSKLATYIAASQNRGTATIIDHSEGISDKAVLVHDCWKAHFQTSVGLHQLCAAHLVRELNLWKNFTR